MNKENIKSSAQYDSVYVNLILLKDAETLEQLHMLLDTIQQSITDIYNQRYDELKGD